VGGSNEEAEFSFEKYLITIVDLAIQTRGNFENIGSNNYDILVWQFSFLMI